MTDSQTFELTENFKGNENHLKFIVNDLTFDLFKQFIDRSSENIPKKYNEELTLKQKRTEYLKLIEYCKDIIKNDFILKVKYTSNKCPRFFSESYSLQKIFREFRGFLCRGIMTDIDIKNSQPTVIRWICHRYKILCPYLDMYVKDRENILKNNNLHKLDIITSMNSCHLRKTLKNDFFNECDREMKKIQKKLIEQEELAFLKENIEEDNFNGKFLNKLYFLFESKIMMFIKGLLEGQNLTICSYNLDGYMVKGILDSKMLIYLNTEIRTEFELDEYFSLTYKEHCNKIELPFEWKPKEEIIEDNDELFFKKSKEFELTHCKIVEKNLYINETDEEYQIMNRETIKGAYEHLSCGKTKEGKNISFIDKWLNVNPEIRKYTNMDIFPKESKCPKNIFNLWKPFRIINIPSKNIEEISEEVKILLKHIKILCNNDEVVYDYFIKWIAQIFQYPEVKTVCPTFISKEGAGKGTLLKLLKGLMGKKKVFETTDPLRDVFGNFNGLLKDAFLVNLNEIGLADMKKTMGKMKGLITDDVVTINEKNVKPYEIKTFHRFLITTNNEEPIVVTKDTRRNVIIRCSDELIGNKDYFNKINEIIENNDLLREFYDYLMNIKDMDKFNKLPLPVTEHQKNLSDLSIPVIEQFIKDWTIENFDNKERIKSFTSNELYECFVEWREKNKIKYEINVLKLMVRLKNCNIKGITKKKTKIQYLTVFNVDELINHFNIVDIDENED
jgi:hypothetical protein